MRRDLFIASLCAALCPGLAARAATTSWNTNSNGVFSVAANWDNGVPDSTKTADFARTGVSYTVTFNGAASGFPPPQYQCAGLVVGSTNNVTFTKNSLLPIAPNLTATGEIDIGATSNDNATLNTSFLVSCAAAHIATTGGVGNLNVNVTFNIIGSGGALQIGNTLGTGTLSINGGGRVNLTSATGDAYIGEITSNGFISFPGTGTVNVTGTGSTWSVGEDLVVGARGSGTLNITGGGNVNVGRNLSTGEPPGLLVSPGHGDITVSGAGSLLTASGLTIGFLPTGPNPGGSGTLTLASGGVVTTNSAITIVNGSLSGTGTINGDLQNPSGTVALATPFGTLNVNGNFGQNSAASLQIALGGTTAGTNYDQLIVSRDMALFGTLQISLANSFSPSLGDRFHVLAWGGTLSGTFGTQLPALTGTLAWNTDALYTSGVLSVIDTNFLPGDFDRNGHVNVADIAPMQAALADLSNYQSAHGNMTNAQLVSIGDLNGDGLVNSADLQGLIDLLANGGGSGAATLSAVPEPASSALAALGSLSALAWAGLRRGSRQ